MDKTLLNSLFNSESADIEIIINGEPLIKIHKEILYKHSQVFYKMLNNGMKESATKQIICKDYSKKILVIFFRTLYCFDDEFDKLNFDELFELFEIYDYYDIIYPKKLYDEVFKKSLDVDYETIKKFKKFPKIFQELKCGFYKNLTGKIQKFVKTYGYFDINNKDQMEKCCYDLYIQLPNNRSSNESYKCCEHRNSKRQYLSGSYNGYNDDGKLYCNNSSEQTNVITDFCCLHRTKLPIYSSFFENEKIEYQKLLQMIPTLPKKILLNLIISQI